MSATAPPETDQDRPRRQSYLPVLPSEGSYDVEPGDEPVPWRKLAIWAAVLGLVVTFVLTVSIPRTKAGADAKVRVGLAECAPVPEAVRTAILAKVNPGTTVVAWAERESADNPGVWFVSGEVRERGLAAGAPGEIATWATRDPQSAASDYAMMEPIARKVSTWNPRPATLDIRDAGAIGSRYCTYQLREDRWRKEFPAFS